ncbi:hypothetical protein [Roseovarius spongiae]|uniref:hypothetical protein n=1 Tax=Roseovarius spongiae TaxID=2320272 RepID=UPI0011C3EB2F|nr:hypothetical protein [Roseovarius spongiae]
MFMDSGKKLIASSERDTGDPAPSLTRDVFPELREQAELNETSQPHVLCRIGRLMICLERRTA